VGKERAKLVDEREGREANRRRGTAEPLGEWRRRRKVFEEGSLGSAHSSRHRSSTQTLPISNNPLTIASNSIRTNWG